MSRRSSKGLTPVRAEPADAAEQVTQLLAGEPVAVLEERDGWARIETEYAYPGWVRAEELGPEGRWDVLEEARRFLGAPYEWGGLSERGIDCSGLVHMAFRRCGILVPRDADQQEAVGERVPAGEERPGDVLCYGDHVAFWLDGGRILHATGRAGVEAVVEENQPPELANRLRCVVRLGERSLDRGSSS
jgi:hypothetical protein